MNILIADDDPHIKKIISKSAQKWGYDVSETENGTQALEILEQEDPPQIAILDWNMPGITGIDICKMLKTKDSPFIYRIILTARSSANDLMEALDNGAHDFQSKPLNLGELKSRLFVGTRLVEANNKIDRYAKSMEMIAKEKAYQLIEMEKKSRVDDLTGAHSRRYWMECANVEFTRCKAGKMHLAVIVIDVDNFKTINDQYGHMTGDKVLTIISNICRRQLRQCDLFARLGGDEFIGLISEVPEDTTQMILDRIVNAIETQDECEYKLNVSCGKTMIQEDDQSIDSMIERADNAMYEHKKQKQKMGIRCD